MGKLEVYNSSGALKVSSRAHPDIQTFEANGTWNKPSGATLVQVIAIAGGGGGGSGRRGAAGTIRRGGGGGAGGQVVQRWLPADLLGDSEAVTVGLGGAGGDAIGGADTDGENGAAGGDSSFGSHVTTDGGNGGVGGGAGSGGQGGGSVRTIGQFVAFQGGVGADANDGGGAPPNGSDTPFIDTSTGTTNAGVHTGAAGGGAGGSISAGDVHRDGSDGGDSYALDAGVGGTAPGGDGTEGQTGNPDHNPLSWTPGAGGGGGAARHGAGDEGNGGGGGAWGGGGGGGGAKSNTGTSGAGGDGAPGLVVVISW